MKLNRILIFVSQFSLLNIEISKFSQLAIIVLWWVLASQEAHSNVSPAEFKQKILAATDNRINGLCKKSKETTLACKQYTDSQLEALQKATKENAHEYGGLNFLSYICLEHVAGEVDAREISRLHQLKFVSDPKTKDRYLAFDNMLGGRAFKSYTPAHRSTCLSPLGPYKNLDDLRKAEAKNIADTPSEYAYPRQPAPIPRKPLACYAYKNDKPTWCIELEYDVLPDEFYKNSPPGTPRPEEHYIKSCESGRMSGRKDKSFTYRAVVDSKCAQQGVKAACSGVDKLTGSKGTYFYNEDDKALFTSAQSTCTTKGFSWKQ